MTRRLGRQSLLAGFVFVVVVVGTGFGTHLLERADWDDRWIEATGTATSSAQQTGDGAVIDVAYVDHRGSAVEATLPVFSFHGRDDPATFLAARVGEPVPVLVPRAGGQAYAAHHLPFELPIWVYAGLIFGAVNAVFVFLGWWVYDLLRSREERRAGLPPVATAGTPVAVLDGEEDEPAA